MFEPVFDTIDISDVRGAANAINCPHEDFPDKVDNTAMWILTFIEDGYTEFTTGQLKALHGFMFPELSVDAGRFRMCNVRFNHSDDQPCNHIFINEEMEKLGNVSVDTPDLTKWYQAFQTIHPFKDGNGRVGGVVLAVISAAKCGFMVVPKGV